MILFDKTGNKRLATIDINRPLIVNSTDLVALLRRLKRLSISKDILVSIGSSRTSSVHLVLEESLHVHRVLTDSDVFNVGIALYTYLPRSLKAEPHVWREVLHFFGSTVYSDVSHFCINGERVLFPCDSDFNTMKEMVS